MSTLEDLLKFAKLTHKFQQTKRAVLVRNEKRFENDLEHSYQLAMLAWYLVDSENLKINKNKVVQYALVHDLVEVYAGDTHFYYGDKKLKLMREKKALLRIKKEFPKFKDIHKLIKLYEKSSDKESRFVHTLDKLIPVLNIYLDNGRTWKSDGITYEMLISNKTPYFAQSKELSGHFNQLVKRLKKQPSLFAKK